MSAAAGPRERFEELAPFPDHSTELAALVGQASGSPNLSPDAVNVPMIRHWVEAMGDHNPVYLSDAAAREAGYDQLIAPPTMLQAWIMRGLRASLLIEEARAAGAEQGAGTNDIMMGLLDDEGLTSVVATNCEQHYVRPLVVGDRLLARSAIESISEPKRTGLGTGRFLTTRIDYVAVPDPDVPPVDEVTPEVVQALFDAGEPVATMRFRILKYLPPDRTPPRPPRPRPALTQDNAFWFEGAQAHRLLIQRCASCGTLRHPPLPACAVCGSLDWDTVESSGRGTLYSYVVVHYPQVPGFEYPLPIGLIELEEGTRLVANLAEMPMEDIEVGMALRAEFVDFDEDLSLPVFVRAGVGLGEWCLMDFALSEEQLAASEAASAIFAGMADPERIAAVEVSEERVDRGPVAGSRRRRPLGPGGPRGRRRRRLRAHGTVPAARGARRSGGTGAAVAHALARRAPDRALRLRGAALGDPAWRGGGGDDPDRVALGQCGQPDVDAVGGRDAWCRRRLGLAGHRTRGAPGAHRGVHRRAGS